jgi:periplasmic protein TonB
MAFVDIPSGRINPKSLGATLIINGALIATIATMMPGGIADVEAITHIITIPTEPPPPLPPDPPQTKDTKQVKQGEIDHVTVPPSTGEGPSTDNDTQVVISGGDIIIPGTGTGTTIIDPPPMTHDIIRTGAKPDPRFAAYLQPGYPRGALHDGAEGRATVRVLVGADGRVKEVVLIRADRPDFFDATRDQALRKWRFTPATEDGTPIESWREMTVRFEMPEGA